MKEVVWSPSLLFLYPFSLSISLDVGSLYLRPPNLHNSRKSTQNWPSLCSVLGTQNRHRHSHPVLRSTSALVVPAVLCHHTPASTLTSGISSMFKKHTVCTHFPSFGFLWKSAFRASFLFAFLFISLLKVVNRCPALEATVGKQRLLGGLERDQVSREVSFSDVNIVSPKATPRSAGATQGRARLGWVSRKLPGFAQGNTLGI